MTSIDAPPVVERREFVERARQLVSTLSAREPACLAERCVPAASIVDLTEAGFFRLAQPPRYGGLDADFDLVGRVAEELVQGCASTAWVYGVMALHHRFLAAWPDEAQDAVWGDDPDGLISSGLQPRPVRRVPGGYRVSGDWPFSSGCDHAAWTMVGGLAEGQPPVLMLVPIGAATIVDDWFTLGLRGTGSKTLRFDDVFVPDEFVVPHGVIGDVRRDQRAKGHGTYWDDTPIVDGAIAFATVVLGLARKGLDIVTSTLRTRVSRGRRLAEVELHQMRVAEAAAAIDLARFDLHEGGRAVAQRLRAGEHYSQLEANLRGRNIAVDVRRLREAVDLLSLSHTSWIYDDDPFQQVHRDAFTASTHLSGRWEFMVIPTGKQLIDHAGEAT